MILGDTTIQSMAERGILGPFGSLPYLYFRWSFLDDQLLTFHLKIDLCFLMHSKVNNHSKKKRLNVFL